MPSTPPEPLLPHLRGRGCVPSPPVSLPRWYDPRDARTATEPSIPLGSGSIQKRRPLSDPARRRIHSPPPKGGEGNHGVSRRPPHRVRYPLLPKAGANGLPCQGGRVEPGSIRGWTVLFAGLLSHRAGRRGCDSPSPACRKTGRNPPLQCGAEPLSWQGERSLGNGNASIPCQAPGRTPSLRPGEVLRRYCGAFVQRQRQTGKW